MLELKDLYNSILVRGRRSTPTFDQVRKDARAFEQSRTDANLYRF